MCDEDCFDDCDCDCDGGNSGKVACAGICCALLIASAVMIGVSFSELKANEVGLEYNANTLKVNRDKLFKNGRHFLGLGHSFFKYPSRLQSVAFSNTGADGGPIIARTQEGLEVELQVAFNYQIFQNIRDVSRLYLDFGEMNEVQRIYNRIARNWVRSVAANYTAFEFFFNRSTIQADMQDTLDRELAEAHARVDQLQLLDVDLPDAFEAARERQAAAVEEIRAASSLAAVRRQEAEDGVRAASQALQVLLLEAQSTASEVLNQAEASTAGLEARLAAERQSLANLTEALEFSESELLAFVWSDAVREAQAAGHITVNLDTPDSLETPY